MENGLFSFSNLHRCYLKCRRSKRNTVNALRFEMNLEENLCRLERELKTRSYQPARSVCFVVKKPKFREVFAADFRDRVVHHVLVDYLERIFEPRFIFDSWACRAGKGAHNGVARLRKMARRVTANGTRGAFFLQMDVKNYFGSIDKALLLNLLRRATSRSDVLWLAERIINSDCKRNCVFKGNRGLFALLPPHKTLFNAPAGRGLPIGNLTSQFFANVYLNEMDQFIKRGLKVKHYVRYVDDFILLSESAEELAAWRGQITDFLRRNLQLDVHPQKQRIAPVSDGMDFLGYIVRPGYMLARRRVVNNFKRELKRVEAASLSPLRKSVAAGSPAAAGPAQVLEFSQTAKINNVTNSYLAHLKHSCSHRLVNALIAKHRLISEMRRAARLAEPHYFPNLAAQYKYFKGALSGIEYYNDENNQMCFRERPVIIFFPIGRFYVFYGQDAAAAGRVLGQKVVKGGDVKPHLCMRMGPDCASFPLLLWRKYAEKAVAKGFTVYIFSEIKAARFDHRLASRILTNAVFQAAL